MLSKMAYVFGFFLLAAGLLGFVPAVTPDHLLFGVFHVNTLHNVVHVVSGVAFLAAGRYGWSKEVFQVFGVVYLAVALSGFYYGNQPIFGLIANNTADNFLHVVTGAVAVWLGFCHKCCNRCTR